MSPDGLAFTHARSDDCPERKHAIYNSVLSVRGRMIGACPLGPWTYKAQSTQIQGRTTITLR